MKRQNVRVSSDRHAAVPGPARSTPFALSPLGVTTGRHSPLGDAGPGSTRSTPLAPEPGPSTAWESPPLVLVAPPWRASGVGARGGRS